MNKLKELIKKKQELKRLQEEVKLLEAELLKEGLEEEQVNNYIVKKVVRLSFKLKDDADIDKIIEEYPEATKIQIDTKVLSKLPIGKEVLEVKETEYLQVKKVDK